MPFIKLPELSLHYEHAGRGRTVLVLVHGNFASWRWWSPFLQNLPADEYTVYALDLRGCGDSDHPDDGYTIPQMAEDLYHFARALKLPRFHLVGHSLGGAVSLQFALNHPTLLHTLLLTAPAPAEGMPGLKRNIFGIGAVELNHLVRSLDLSRSVLRQALKDMMPNLPHDTKEFKALIDDATRMSPGALDGFITTLADWNVLDELSDLALPVLILWGEQDRIVKRDALERMIDVLPEAQLVTWPEAGHVPQLEYTEQFQTLLLEFVNTHCVSYALFLEPPINQRSWKLRFRQWWQTRKKKWFNWR